MSNNFPKNSKWELHTKLGKGGQGQTYLVCSKTSEVKTLHVLKHFVHPEIEERRQRFTTEVETLRKLDHPGTARWVDDNADEIGQTKALYLVTQYVPGPSLSQLIGTDCLLRAIKITATLLNTLEYCHAKGILHRDIKPDNIVMNKYGDPVLIDFGLAFDLDESIIRYDTSLEQDIGNRFIVLPEQRGPGQSVLDKRDPRSDIAATVGIFFYLLTGIRPGLLLALDHSMPHQRGNALPFLRSTAAQRFQKLAALFDKGFRYSPDDRFQTIAALQTALADLIADQPMPGRSKNLGEAIERLSSTQDYQLREKRVAILRQIADGLTNAHQTVGAPVADVFDSTQSSSNLDAEAQTYRNHVGFNHRIQSNLKVLPTFTASFIGCELVTTASFNGVEETLWRVPENDFENNHQYQDAVRHYLQKILTSRIDQFVDGLV